MNKTKHFALHFAAAALLIGTSAFAESRHENATSRSGERHDRDRSSVQRQSGERDSRSYTQQRTETRNWNNNNRSYDRNNNYNRNENRSYDRNRTYDRNRSFEGNRSYDRNRGYENRGYDRNRGYENRGYDRNRGYENRGYDRNRGNAFYHDGRISRIEHWNGGYRVWFGGFGYPFFIPEARFRLFNWRVGLSIHLGGFWNPLGYYDYYDGVDPYYGTGYANVVPYAPGTVATSGYVRGVVESVDYRRGSMVIRDDASGSFVTIMMRGDDPRFDSLRNGDYVSLSGDWVRGYFEAYRVDNVDDGYYRR
ncbi:MAG TPA: hypothetical protein VHU41_08810 [Thermoanaerobaculia bacterium]|nr:hypothetical protein [Thermoanaerobaculia bacterium]